MKLIQILALATAMATMATAQNSSANGQKNDGAKPSPTATPAGKTQAGNKTLAGTAQAGNKTPAAGTAKSGAATAARTGSAPASARQGAGAPAGKPAMQAAGGTDAAKGKGTAAKGVAVKVKTGSVPAAKGSAPQPAVKMKAATPVVSAKGAASAKNAAATKTKPAVIAVRPAQKTAKKTTGAMPAKAPAAAPKVAQTAAEPAKMEEKPKPSARAFGAHGRRDPFVSPIRREGVNNPTPNCTSGKRCLAIPELVLQGTVKDMTGKMLAVVATSTKKTYFLRENDQVFNGSVEKITSDSIIFREYGKDALGRETGREVVKKLVPTT